jgi:hypothetical protein
VLRRRIAERNERDAMGLYPLFVCRDWRELPDDLAELADNTVSIGLVTDPFGNFDPALLNACFPGRARPYKDHFVTDLHLPPESFVSAHHRRYARKALSALQVEVCDEPLRYLDDWHGLYQELIERHQIRGMARFSHTAFACQLAVPGLLAMRALLDGQTVGMVLWYIHEGRAYYHLAAYNDAGYAQRASFALFWTALAHLRERVRWLDLGAGAGLSVDANDGLTAFKRGWSTGTLPTYFCGRIFDQARYDAAVEARGIAPGSTAYFPAYRVGEFA